MNNRYNQQSQPRGPSQLPPPIHGSFVGGSKPPGGGFGQYGHLDRNNSRQYDGKALRKAVQRRTIDLNSTIVRYLQDYRIRRKQTDYPWIQRQKNFIFDYYPTFAKKDSLQFVHENIPTRFVHSAINKIKCPVNAVKYTPDGRRLITGLTSGEFTLWNSISFNFETLLQAHDHPVRQMIWSHNSGSGEGTGEWMVSCDNGGYVKYWASNMNNVAVFQAHKDHPVRNVSLSPSDTKLATCSDDATIRIFDFLSYKEERILTGHGWDVRCIDWHPFKALIASGSKDNMVKLWDPKSGKELSTFHGHKNTVLACQWNSNGNWLLVGSRDQMVKLYDIRAMKELQSFKGHANEVNSAAWHPHIETLFVTGDSLGSLYSWVVGENEPVGRLESAHDSNIWTLDWHPLGHVLCSGSNDFHTRFWTRHRPEDAMNDSYIVGKSETEMSSRGRQSHY